MYHKRYVLAHGHHRKQKELIYTLHNIDRILPLNVRGKKKQYYFGQSLSNEEKENNYLVKYYCIVLQEFSFMPSKPREPESTVGLKLYEFLKWCSI